MHACTAQAKCLPCSWASKVDCLASLPTRRTVPFGHEKACTDQSTVAAAGSIYSHYPGLPACRGCEGLEAAQGAAVAAGEAEGPSNRQAFACSELAWCCADVQAVCSCAPPMVDHHHPFAAHGSLAEANSQTKQNCPTSAGVTAQAGKSF
eukprot:1161227-Pelagomonas_calceolata.AAC.1